MNLFRPYRSADLDSRLNHIEDGLARISTFLEALSRKVTASSGDPTGGGLQAVVQSTGGGGSGSGGGSGTLAGDVTGPATQNVVEQIQETPIAAPVANDDLKVPVYVHGSVAIAWRTPPFDYRSESADYTATLHDFVIDVDATGAARTITLPTAASAANYGYYIRKTDSSVNTVTIDANGAETINGAANYVISVQYEAVLVVSNGTSWGIY